MEGNGNERARNADTKPARRAHHEKEVWQPDRLDSLPWWGGEMETLKRWHLFAMIALDEPEIVYD